MKKTHELGALRETVAAWRRAGDTIALVPTMGNLHAGHLALVERARARADKTVASLYVNPAQFAPGEDFSAYPRTPQADLDALAGAGCDLAWLPDDHTMYPSGLEQAVRLSAPPALADILCGRYRPGHFDGVVTVVVRLFNQVRPDIAVFGEKDYQQWLIIRRMAEDLSLDIRIEAAATVREADGLAMSSRNRYLTIEERERAPAFYQALQDIARKLTDNPGNEDFAALEAQAKTALTRAGLAPEYVAILRAADLQPARPGLPLRILAAARLGQARLIDNIAP